MTKENFRERRLAFEMQGSVQETSILHTGSPPALRACVNNPHIYRLEDSRSSEAEFRAPEPPSSLEVSRMPAPRLTLARAPCCWSRRAGEGGGLCTWKLIKSKQRLSFRLAPRRRRGRPSAGRRQSHRPSRLLREMLPVGRSSPLLARPPGSLPWQRRRRAAQGRPDVAWTLAGDGGPDGGHPQRHLDAISSCCPPRSHQRRHAKEGRCPDLEPLASFVRVRGALGAWWLPCRRSIIHQDTDAVM